VVGRPWTIVRCGELPTRCALTPGTCSSPPTKTVDSQQSKVGCGSSPTYDLPPTNYHSFQQHSRFLLVSPLFSCTFQLRSRPSKPGTLFSTTFPRRSFIFKKLLFSFSSENGLVVHLREGSFPGFWPRLGHCSRLMKNVLVASEQDDGVL